MLADIVGPVVARGSFPVVLGGDCSILLGNLLALRRTGRRHGLLFLDGHADFYQPEASTTGEAADMDLALSTGRGPDILANIEGLRPLVRDADVAVLGPRDAEQAREYGSQPLPPTIFAQDLQELRRVGADEAARAAIEHLCRPELDGFWIHLDVDVLDDAIMPAVGYRMPDGLSWQELETILNAAMRSGRARGINITIFEPKAGQDRRHRARPGEHPGARPGALARCAAGVVRAAAAPFGHRRRLVGRDLTGERIRPARGDPRRIVPG